MKFPAFLCLSAVLCFCLGCRDQAKSPDRAPAQDSTQKKDSPVGSYLPVAYFLMSEIRQIDTLPLPLFKYTSRTRQTAGSRRPTVPGPSDPVPMDSVLISVPEFNQLARQFLPDELEPAHFQNSYAENSFADKTTQSVTFSYSPLQRSASLQRVDVVTENGQGSNRIRSIYLQRTDRHADTLVTKKMFWRAQHFFQVTTITQVGRGSASTSQLKVIWNPIETTD